MSIAVSSSITAPMAMCIDDYFTKFGYAINRIKTPNYEKTSYGLKHILQRDTGLYLTNNEFKDAMLLCGYEPVNPDTINWNYCISKRSPAFIHN